MSNKPSITRIVKFIRKGENGNSVIVADTASRHYTYAQWQIYGTVGHLKTWGSINNVAKFKVGDTIVINGVCTDRGNISVSLYATVGAVNAGNKSVTATTTSLIMSGENGERGPALRGPQDWGKLPVGYSFQAGKDGDEWKDVVVYKGNYASCIKGHTKTSTNYPGSTDDSNNGYWSVTNKWEIVATNILLTSYALIKNLGVEVIDMKDSDGNILFQAKDGKVVCKTGTFENVSVNGIIHSSLTYSSVKRIVNLSSYTIDPQKEAFNTLFVSTGSTCRVYLPDANAYEGLELNIYQNVVSTMELGSVIMSTYNQSQRIYCSNGTALINGTVVMTINSFPMGDNNFKIIPNILTRLLAVNGNWYVLSGALTGE